jgi:hypothetical protein
MTESTPVRANARSIWRSFRQQKPIPVLPRICPRTLKAIARGRLTSQGVGRGDNSGGHASESMPRSVYGLGMPRRKRKGSGPQPTAKPQSSDQAPGEEVVQVNDQYRGGEPAPDLQQEEQAQHQTGG